MVSGIVTIVIYLELMYGTQREYIQRVIVNLIILRLEYDIKITSNRKQ